MNKELIVFDTETNGMVFWKEPSGGDKQPHLVQLAAHVVNIKERKITQTMDVIIKPNGWTIPQDCVDIHGITTEYANDIGIRESLAFEMFLDLWSGRLQVAFNTTFDRRIIRIGTKRFFSEAVQDAWKEGEYECAMIAAKKIMQVSKGFKLEDAYKFFTGKEMVNAHSALYDADACLAVHWGIKDHQDTENAA